MAIAKKVTSGNHLPGTGDDRFPVYSKQFNALVDVVNEIEPADGTLSADTIQEETAGNGVVVDGVTLKDGAVTSTAPNTYSLETGITAFATGGQGSAVALTEELNNVTTCATAHDSVKLPAAAAGLCIAVKNSGAAALDIFPSTGDAIDALAVNLAVTIQPGSVANFIAIDATTWESDVDTSITLNSPSTVLGQFEVLAADSAGNTVTTLTHASQAAARTYTIPDAGASANFAMTEGAQTINGVKTMGSPVVYAFATGITAFATGGQGSATALTAEHNNITTCATAGDSVALPVAVAGQVITVKNNGAAACDVFPASGDAIDALAVDLAKSLSPGSVGVFTAIDGTTWESNLEAITLSAPTTETGSLVIKAADSAGDTETTITNASQAAARTYTIPDAGASADFIMGAGAQTIAGAKTFSSALINSANVGTAGTNVTAVENGDGVNFVTTLTLSAVSYTIAGAADEAIGALIYTFPAGVHLHSVSYHSVALTGGGTVDTDTPDMGIGSVIATGAVSVLGGTAGFEDYVTGLATADCSGTASVVGPVGATAGIHTGISLNKAADVKLVHLNIADGWAGADTVTASGTVVLKWSKLA